MLDLSGVGRPVSAAIIVALVVLVGAAEGDGKVEAQSPPEAPALRGKPNVLFVMTDDQDPGSIGKMPKLRNRLLARGTEFPNAYTPTSTCCPSRVSFLRGQYPHNHGVVSNVERAGQGDEPNPVPDVEDHAAVPTDGGFQEFSDRELGRSTIGVWMRKAGYATGYAGKFLNGYGSPDPVAGGDPKPGTGLETGFPPGWDRVWAHQGSRGEFRTKYKVNENGKILTRRFETQSDTDYYSDVAERFIRTDRAKPWFLVVAPNAPHAPFSVQGVSTTSKRNDGRFSNVDLPLGRSFNEEADVDRDEDKPEYIQRLPRLTEEGCGLTARLDCIPEARTLLSNRAEDLRDVDDMVANLYDTLAKTGQLDNTFIVFTSDNGYATYKHRIESKGAPYEETIGVPLVISGPGVPRGATKRTVVGNMDFAPTIARWGGASVPSFVDGRSFAGISSAFGGSISARDPMLIEYQGGRNYAGVFYQNGDRYIENYSGAGTEPEYYDLDTDPLQLTSRPDLVTQEMRNDLGRLKNCSGAGCR